MTLPVVIELEASRELEEAAAWYEHQRQGLGAELLEIVDGTLAHLQRWPDAGAAIPGLAQDVPARRIPIPRFPYHLAYLREPEALRVLAVAHDRRRPGYWQDRVRD